MMVKLADLEKAYLVPCKHCAKPMPGWDLFCPFCETDQSLADGTGDASLHAPIELPLAGAPAAVAFMAMQSAVMPQQGAWESIANPVPASAANEEATFEVGLVRPGVLWQHDLPAAGEAPSAARIGSVVRRRSVIGIVATLGLVLLVVFLHGSFDVRGPREAGALRQVEAVQDEQRPEAVALPVQVFLPLELPTVAVRAVDKRCTDALAALALCTVP